MRALRRTLAVTTMLVMAAGALGFGAGFLTGRGSTVPGAASAHHFVTAIHSDVAVSAASATHEEMDQAHEARVKAFPAKTRGLGNQPLQPKLVAGVKQFELTAREAQWEVEPGVQRTAFAYNGQVPGPIIRVTEGDRVRIILHNELPESTSIHFHGLNTPNAMDGVPFITQPPVRPGQSFTYEFVAAPVGSHMYHSHNGADQITKGLLGAFIVDPRDRSGEPQVTQDIVLIINDGPLGFTINGKSFPATQPIVLKTGQRLRIRYMNEGQVIHPMHLHGLAQQVIAKDGYRLAQPYGVDTIDVAPGERYDLLVEATRPGVWALHCHILSHAESSRGMHGMVTAVIVQP
jgi:FtsP/CotA-like multicopper oxidase with cupredoxin domain